VCVCVRENQHLDTLSTSTCPIDGNHLETLTFVQFDTNLSNEYLMLIDSLVEELSFELTDKPSIDMLLEIEGSLAQRIYDCVVEQTDQTTHSYSRTTADESSVSLATTCE
jgi:predicted AAA+ superfamily ATPase